MQHLRHLFMVCLMGSVLLYSSCDGLKDMAEDLAEVKTLYTSEITTNSAKCSGEIISDGGGEVLDRGICYGLSIDPTTTDAKVSRGTGTGNFSCALTGLNPNTVYYLRAYAENSKGVSYGESIILKTYTATVQDIDGNTYYTLTIGDQEWMASNLRAKHYNDGQMITELSNGSQWVQSNGGAYSAMNNDMGNAPIYGLLYNWHAVGSGKLAPAGWHVATDAEWNTMLNTIGWDAKTAKKLRTMGMEHWSSQWPEGTNESGFSATGSGERNSIGNADYAFFKDRCGIWTSTDNSATSAYFYNIKADQVEKASGHRRHGFAVRCIKD